MPPARSGACVCCSLRTGLALGLSPPWWLHSPLRNSHRLGHASALQTWGPGTGATARLLRRLGCAGLRWARLPSPGPGLASGAAPTAVCGSPPSSANLGFLEDRQQEDCGASEQDVVAGSLVVLLL